MRKSNKNYGLRVTGFDKRDMISPLPIISAIIIYTNIAITIENKNVYNNLNPKLFIINLYLSK